MDWDCFKLTVDNSAYEAVASSLTAMQKLIIWMIVGCVLVSAGILKLILSMWIKQRRHETGILLAVGITKSRIVLIFMIAVLAFGLSYFTSNLVSQGISDLIFHRVAESQEAPEIEVPDDGSEYLDITGQYIPYDTSELETVESVRVNVRPNDLLYILAYCCFRFSCIYHGHTDETKKDFITNGLGGFYNERFGNEQHPLFL